MLHSRGLGVSLAACSCDGIIEVGGEVGPEENPDKLPGVFARAKWVELGVWSASPHRYDEVEELILERGMDVACEMVGIEQIECSIAAADGAKVVVPGQHCLQSSLILALEASSVLTWILGK